MNPSRYVNMNRDTNPSENSFFTVVGRGAHDVRRHNLTKDEAMELQAAERESGIYKRVWIERQRGKVETF